ncbi:MAG: PIG-L family deacetylase [Planctomycetota bacterium]|nr:PIG-L family deacetylase [Planctomycetota bacterium]
MNILVIGPHPDDQEIGMGGSIALLASQGHNVLLVDMTDGCPTPVGDRPTRLQEAAEAARVLGVRRVLLDLPNRKVEHTLDARHRLAGVIRAHQSHVLFVPHPLDAHPDHLATTRIAIDARFDAKLTKTTFPDHPDLAGSAQKPIYPFWLFFYYCSHLRRVPDPSFLLDVSDFAARKLQALRAYRSQFELNPNNHGLVERVGAQDAFFGSRIGAAAAEPFFAQEPLGLMNLTGLLMAGVRQAEPTV